MRASYLRVTSLPLLPPHAGGRSEEGAAREHRGAEGCTRRAHPGARRPAVEAQAPPPLSPALVPNSPIGWRRCRTLYHRPYKGNKKPLALRIPYSKPRQALAAVLLSSRSAVPTGPPCHRPKTCCPASVAMCRTLAAFPHLLPGEVRAACPVAWEEEQVPPTLGSEAAGLQTCVVWRQG